MTHPETDYELARQIHTVLVLHYIEGLRQSEIAQQLNLSTSKVNRLIALGRREGMVRIEISSPFQRLADLEKELTSQTSLSSAVVTPSVSNSGETQVLQVGRAAANVLMETLRDGDVIAITGGKAISAVVEHLAPDCARNVTVVPLTGGVQGRYYTDVNHLASRFAEKLGGRAMLVHAPLFAESRDQRDVLMDMASIREVFDLARSAAVALVGIGSIKTPGSSYYDLHPTPNPDRDLLDKSGAVGEFMAHLIKEDGKVADYPLNMRLVALDPLELSRCPKTIGVAAGTEKVQPIGAALNGRFLDALVTDEETASSVLQSIGSHQHAA